MDDDEGMGLAMTADNADGIDEDLTRAVGMAMIAASRAGEQLTRMKQAADRERQARATGNAQRAEGELAAHTEAARAYFEVVTRPEYLHVATDAQIREVTRQAQAWTERLPEAHRAANSATAELGARRPTPDTGSQQQRAAVLAGQAETADQRAAGDQQEAQPSARQAAATASSAQARPAQEAAAAARNVDRQGAGRGFHGAASRVQQPDVGI